MSIQGVRLQELRTALDVGDRYSYREQKDTALDSGDSVEFHRGSGGCGEPTIHDWVIQDAQGGTRTVPIKEERLTAASGVTIGAGGRVVGQFHDYQAHAPEAEVERARERGVAQDLSSYYLAEVPVHGGLGAIPNWLRRSGVLKPKKLAFLPENATSFDMGPNRTIAVAADQRVLRWTKKSGLEPWLQFDREVRKVEFLKDGGLAVAVASAQIPSGVDGLYFAPGSQTPEVAGFKELFPERYSAQLADRVRGVAFLVGHDLDEAERFLENSAWLSAGSYWKTHRALAAGDGNRVAVPVNDDKGWSLHLYDRATGKAVRLGGVGHPDSQRSKADEYDPSGRMQWSADGQYVLYTSSVEKEGEPVDLTVWDTKSGRPALVPGIRDLRVEGAEIAFRPLDGEEVRIPLADAPKMAETPWYRQAVVRDLLGAEAPSEDPGTIQQHEETVQVGELTLPIRK